MSKKASALPKMSTGSRTSAKSSRESLPTAIDSNVVVAAAAADDHYWIIGDRCVYNVNGTPAKIAFLGETRFGDGEWAGLVFDHPIGKNDGSVNGVRYFQCPPNCGLFCRLEKLTKIVERSPSPPNQDAPSNEDEFFGSSSTSLRVGDRAAVLGSPDKKGVVRFLGVTKFAAGRWAGLELDNPNGKNDGSVQGERYFTCRPRYGVFVPVSKLIPTDVKSPPPSSLFRTPKRSSLADSISNLSTISCTSSVRSQAAPPAVRHNVASKLRIGRHETAGGGSQESLSSVFSTASKTSKFKEHLTTAEASSSIKSSAKSSVVENHEECSRNLHALQMQMDQVCLSLQQAVKDSKNFEVLYEEEKTKTDDLQFRLEEEVVVKQQLEAKVAEMERLLTDMPTMTSTPEKAPEKSGESKEYLDKLEGLEFEVKEEILARKEAEKLSENLQQKMECEKAVLQQKISEQGDKLEGLEFEVKEEILARKEVEKLSENLQQKMECEKAALQQKISEQGDEIQFLNSQLSKMHTELDDQNIKSGKFEEKIQNLQSEIEKIRDENEILRQNSKNELEKHIYETRVLQNEAQDLKNQRNLFEEKHDEVQTEYQTLKRELDDLRMRCADSNEKESYINALKLEFHEFKNMSSQRENELQEKLLEMEEVNGIVSLKQEELDILNLKFEECKAESSKVEDELSKKLEEIRTKYANLESVSQNTAFEKQKKIDDLQKSFDEYSAENLKLSEKLLQTEEKFANIIIDSQKNAENQNAEFDNVRNDLNDKICKLEDECKSYIANLEVAEKNKSDFESRNAEFKNMETNLNDKIRKLEDECKNYVSNFELLKEDHKKELMRAENDYKILQESQLKNASDSEKKNVEFHSLEKNFNDKIRKLENECKSHVSNIEVLKKDYEEELRKAGEDYKILQENRMKDASDFETRILKCNALEKDLYDKIFKLEEKCKDYVSKLEILKQHHEEELEKIRIDYQEDECKNHLLNVELTKERHLGDEIDALQRDFDILKVENSKAEQEHHIKFQEMVAQTQELSANRQELIQKLENLNSINFQKEKEMHSLQQSLEEVKQESSKRDRIATETLEKAENKIKSLILQLDKKQKSLDNLQKISDESKALCTKMETVAADAENELKKVVEKLDFVELQLAEKNEQIHLLQSRQNTTELEKDQSNVQTENLKLKYEKICTENESLKSKIIDLERLQAELAGENSAIKLCNQESVKLFEDKEKDCANKSLQLQNLEIERNSLETKCKELENGLHSLENDITILQRELIQSQERNTTLTKDFDAKFESKLKHFNQVSEKYEKVKKEHEKRKTELNQLLDECSTSNELIKNLRLENQRLTNIVKKDLESRSNTKIDNDQDSRLQIEFLNSVIADLGAKNRDLEMKLEIFKNCPKQASGDFSDGENDVKFAEHHPQGHHSKNRGQRGQQRPYCENCEAFLHDTEDCDQVQTF
uniref:CAP-Gly domain-containing protein n=1 Tax=Romanomermis culicivorax TaxID=13658 RepID=A0A915J1J4_ROMCU